MHRIAWVVPAGLASPLVLLGALQFGVPAHHAVISSRLGDREDTMSVKRIRVDRADPRGESTGLGVAVVLLPLVRGWWASTRAARRYATLRDPAWLDALRDAQAVLGMRRPVRLLVARERMVPVTWGVLRPVIVVPESILDWDDVQRRAVVLHELAHISAADVLFGVTARVMCALYWFHPGAWWVARRLRAECEFACDDRVLAGGVMPSSYSGGVGASVGCAPRPPSDSTGRDGGRAPGRAQGATRGRGRYAPRHSSGGADVGDGRRGRDRRSPAQ